MPFLLLHILLLLLLILLPLVLQLHLLLPFQPQPVLELLVLDEHRQDKTCKEEIGEPERHPYPRALHTPAHS
jgi:hypothetical protein